MFQRSWKLWKTELVIKMDFVCLGWMVRWLISWAQWLRLKSLLILLKCAIMKQMDFITLTVMFYCYLIVHWFLLRVHFLHQWRCLTIGKRRTLVRGFLVKLLTLNRAMTRILAQWTWLMRSMKRQNMLSSPIFIHVFQVNLMIGPCLFLLNWWRLLKVVKWNAQLVFSMMLKGILVGLKKVPRAKMAHGTISFLRYYLGIILMKMIAEFLIFWLILISLSMVVLMTVTMLNMSGVIQLIFNLCLMVVCLLKRLDCLLKKFFMLILLFWSILCGRCRLGLIGLIMTKLRCISGY